MGSELGRSFYLRVSLFYLRLVFVAYGQLAWSFLLTVWSFLLTVEIRFGLFYLRFPPLRKLGLLFFAYGSPCPFGLFCLRFPHRNWKRLTVSKKTSTVSKKDASQWIAGTACESECVLKTLTCFLALRSSKRSGISLAKSSSKTR